MYWLSSSIRRLRFAIVPLFLSSLFVFIGIALAAPSALLNVNVTTTSVEPGEVMRYTLRYRCASLTEHCTNAEISHSLPAGFIVGEFTSAGGNVQSVNQVGNTITWDMGAVLPAGSTGVITVRGRFPSCGDSPIAAGIYTATSEFTVDGVPTTSIDNNITLNNAVDACPVLPTPPIGLNKSSPNNDVALDGVVRYQLDFPAAGGVPYVVTDTLPVGFIPSMMNAEPGMVIAVECANSGVFHRLNDAKDLNDPGDLNDFYNASSGSYNYEPPECVGLENDRFSNAEQFNITRIRYEFDASFGGETNVALNGFMYSNNPFDGMSVTLPDTSTGPALPNWESPASLVGSKLVNCIDSSLGGSACNEETMVNPGPMPYLDKNVLGSPSEEFTGVSSQTQKGVHRYAGVALDLARDGTILDANATSPLIQQGPNDIIYSIRIQDQYGSEDWADPFIVDLLPAELEYIPQSEGGTNWYVIDVENEDDFYVSDTTESISYANPACHNPTFTTTDDYNGTGQQLLAWDFSGCALPVGDDNAASELYIYFSATIKPGTLESTLIHNFPMAVGDFASLNECDRGGAAGGSEHDPYWPHEVDLTDLDGDGNLGEDVCRGDEANYTTQLMADFVSSKYVQGTLDTQFSRYPAVGVTDLTGSGLFQLEIVHSGNITVTELDIADVLPHVGDTDVSGIGLARGSVWGMKLASDLLIETSFDGGNTWTTLPTSELDGGAPRFAASTNPCLYKTSSPDGDDLSITGTFPASCETLSDSTSPIGAKAFGFRYVPHNGMVSGSRLRVTFSAEIDGNPPGCDDPACVGDNTTPDAIAWNSFAFGGTYQRTDGTFHDLLDTEPIKVGLEMFNTSATTSLGNYVWHDANGDGVQGASETPFEGVNVTLYAADGTTKIGSTATDASGFYKFYNLDPSTTYVIKLDNPADYSSGVLSGYSLTTADQGGDDSADSDATYDINNYPVITATTGAVLGTENAADPTEYPTNDFGFWQPAAIGDTIWYDLDGVGDQNEEGGVDGVTVRLYSAGADGQSSTGDDSLVDTTTTDADGNYLFEGLPEGNYYLTFDYSTISDTHPVSGTVVNSADFVWTLADATGNDATDSDTAIRVGTVATTTVTYLSAGETDRTWDGGLMPAPQPPANPISVGNYVWEDRDADGAQDGDEPGYPGVTVQLIDGTGFPIDSTSTDANGYYQFENLDATQSYEIVFLAPDGTTLTTANDATAGDLADSDADPTTGSTGTFTPNEDGDGNNGDGLDERWDAGIIPTLSLGNQVWSDLDDDGVYDAGETGLSGLTVRLLDAGGSVITTTTTDASGRYLFDGLTPGTYSVEVEQPNGYRPSAVNASDPNNGSDDDNNGVSEITSGYIRSNYITLAYGDAPTDESDHGAAINDITDTTLNYHADYSVDFGFFQPLELGNLVWFDSDRDGVQDDNEPGIDGVTVQLLNSGGTVIDTTTTSAGGQYLFTGLQAGDYSVRIPASNFGSGGPLEGTVSSSIDYGNLANRVVYDPDTVPSDTDNNGSDLNGIASLASGTTGNVDSALVTLSAGSEPTTDDTPSASVLDANSNTTVDFGFFVSPLGVIGNYVWLDENGDGMQDEGERGIANVIVSLTNSSGATYTTTTDAHGGYLFDELPVDTYTVTIPASNSGAGGALADLHYTTANPNDGGDFGNQDPNGYVVTIGGPYGLENLSADFGYNYNTANETDNNSGNAALGDRIWIDVDGDGAQDPEEVGVQNVTVTLYHDPDGDGVFDTVHSITTTDANGIYIFDNLPAGAYVATVTDSSSASHDVLGASYVQTGDPDHFGTTGSINDNTTTTPVVLTPGDVFLNADFGYQPNGVTLGTIGDTVWLDANASGTATLDSGEYGIEGVTIALIQDTNGNGTWETGEPIIATDTTDENGGYLFEGLSLNDGDGDADYIVWVNDTDNVIDGLRQTYDQDSPLDHMSNTALSGGTPSDLDQDFSYTPANHDSGEGMIGDTIWFDMNNSGSSTPDSGEAGIEGVIVTLLDSNGIMTTTVTDENGHYLFGGLDPNGTYTVTVSAENFGMGGILAGMHNTFDPHGAANSQSVVTLTSGNPINLDQDFSYVATTPYSLGNLLWLDQNADGDWDGHDGPDGVADTDDDETPIAGVTIDLYRDLNGNGVLDAGEPLLATTTTTDTLTLTGGDSGNYLFTGLPNGDYVVDVTDENGVLAGYWHSRGTDNTTDHSQADPYTVTIADADNLTADFGYYVEPAAIGNFVWFDLNYDGVQDVGEPGINGITMTLVMTYPNGTILTLTTITGDDPSTPAVETGWYSFANLLLDEDYAASSGSADGSASPAFVVSAAPKTGHRQTILRSVSATGELDDANDPTGTAANATQGIIDVTQSPTATLESNPAASYDFGFVRVELGDLPDRYNTFRNNFGAQHIIFPDDDGDHIPDIDGAIWSGTVVDDDADGQHGGDFGATSGDDDDGTDDEDGLVLPPQYMLMVGNTVQFSVTLRSRGVQTADYGLWIDWNADGRFDGTGEFLSNNGVQIDTPVGNGIYETFFTLEVDVPIGTVTHPTWIYVRGRVFAANSGVSGAATRTIANNAFSGVAANGEVEDFATRQLSPTAVGLVSAESTTPATASLYVVLSVFALMMLLVFLVLRNNRRD